MNRFVVDASVAVKWVVPEIYYEAARCLLENKYELLVPDFFFSEVANVFWKRVNRGEDSVDNARVALEAIRVQPMQVYSSSMLISRAFDMAIRTRRAVYDCVYLSLAVEYQCQMVTADEKRLNALQHDSLAAHLLWVEDLR